MEQKSCFYRLIRVGWKYKSPWTPGSNFRYPHYYIRGEICAAATALAAGCAGPVSEVRII